MVSWEGAWLEGNWDKSSEDVCISYVEEQCVCGLPLGLPLGASGEATKAVGGVRAAVVGASEGEGGVEERGLSGTTAAAAEGVWGVIYHFNW